MFATQDVIVALILGLAIGGFAGAIAWDTLVAGRLRRELARSERRRRAAAFRAETASSQAAAFSMLLRTMARSRVDDTALGSRRAPDHLEVVK